MVVHVLQKKTALTDIPAKVELAKKPLTLLLNNVLATLTALQALAIVRSTQESRSATNQAAHSTIPILLQLSSPASEKTTAPTFPPHQSPAQNTSAIMI